jgi:hypothetical protein
MLLMALWELFAFLALSASLSVVPLASRSIQVPVLVLSQWALVQLGASQLVSRHGLIQLVWQVRLALWW